MTLNSLPLKHGVVAPFDGHAKVGAPLSRSGPNATAVSGGRVFYVLGRGSRRRYDDYRFGWRSCDSSD